MDFNNISIDETLKHLTTDKHHGLSNSEILKRLDLYGFNEITEKKSKAIVIFLKKFWNLNAWLLEFIIAISIFLHNYNDFYIVIILLLLNATLGYLQENQANKAVEALKNKLQVNAKVLRDNNWQTIPARELVAGDIIRIRSGDFIPADVKLIEGTAWVNQAALTGESLEVEKEENDILYSGSIVTRSEATGVVILTGANTYFGRTISLVQIAKPKLHIENAITNIIRSLLLVIIILLSIGLIVALHKGIPIIQIIPLFLVILLTVVPVALPTMFTITLARGSKILTKRNVLTTRLNALDDAASMDILCIDKTGTLTQNKMAVVKIMPFSSFNEDEILLFAELASEEANKDPIDMAFIDAVKKKKIIVNNFKRQQFIPFNPNNRRTEAILKDSANDEIQIMKGAFNVIASLCDNSGEEKQKFEATINDFASKGYKTIAILYAKNEIRSIIGLVALQDMPYEDASVTISNLADLGISVKMLTGDALPIAKEIANQVGLGKNIIRAEDFKKVITISPEKAIAMAEAADGFAEIYPEDKYIIVKNLQAHNHIVGMTGDGINDVPALKQAEVGTAIYNAADVAKSAASIVLTTEGLTNIVEPIKVGRMLFQTINTWILQKIIWTVLMASLVVISLTFTGKFILSSSAALFMLLLTDFGKVSLSTDNARWSKKPESRNINQLVQVGVMLAFLVLIEALGILYFGAKWFAIFTNSQSLNTFTFEILFFFETFSIVIVRERGRFWKSKPSNFLLAALIFDVVASVALVTIGLPGLKALPLSVTLFVLSSVLLLSLAVNDWIKIYLLRRFALN